MQLKTSKKIQKALEDLHCASICWGALVQREENNKDFQKGKKKLHMAAYKYYQAVIESTLTSGHKTKK